MRKLVLAITAAAVALPIAPAMADPHRHGSQRHYSGRVYDSQGGYFQPHRLERNDHVWRGRDGRYYCRRDNGTTGLVIGAAVGALAGHEIAGRGDKTLGTVLGAVGGGLLGREIDRGDLKCR